MNILAFTDIHEDMRAVANIKKLSKDADLLVCAGDLSNFGKGLDKTAKALNSIGKPLLIIHGNHETEKDIINLCKKYKNLINLHRGVYELDNCIFFGFGGGGFSKVDLSFERIAKKVMKNIDKTKNFIFVSHAPPRDTALDQLIDLGSVGSISYRKFIEKNKPLLSISGHIEENSLKKDFIGKTLCINPGSRGLILEI